MLCTFKKIKNVLDPGMFWDLLVENIQKSYKKSHLQLCRKWEFMSGLWHNTPASEVQSVLSSGFRQQFHHTTLLNLQLLASKRWREPLFPLVPFSSLFPVMPSFLPCAGTYTHLLITGQLISLKKKQTPYHLFPPSQVNFLSILVCWGGL